MTARVLIVDPVVTTRIVLKVKLAAAYYQVDHAATMAEALEKVSDWTPDIVLCEVDLPDGSARELCAALAPRGIPTVALMSDPEDTSRAGQLAVGLDDVISRPYNDAILQARLRRLLRNAALREELQIHAETSAALGFAEAPTAFAGRARIGIVGADGRTGIEWKSTLSDVVPHTLSVHAPGDVAAALSAPKAPNVLIVGLTGQNARQRLDLIAALRARETAQDLTVLAVTQAEDVELAVLALDSGAGDVTSCGFAPLEIAERVDRLLQRQARDKRMRLSVKAGLQAAVTDPLTGLFNRRYALPYLDRLVAGAALSGRPVAIMVLDLDHFKAINDRHGHQIGDRVLREFSDRLTGCLRGNDLCARIGGEEFLIALPDTSLARAKEIANRVCRTTRTEPFADDVIAGGIAVSVSVGLTLHTGAAPRLTGPGIPPGTPSEITAANLVQRADAALYSAKQGGRDKVHVSRAA